MTPTQPATLWWTARDIAEAALPDCPATQQNVDAMAKRLGWREHPTHARRRAGRGGGWEYNWELLPLRARQKLLRDIAEAGVKSAPTEDQRAETHARFEAMPETVKAKARNRLRILQQIATLEDTGMTKYLAVESVAGLENTSSRTIWRWFDMVELVPMEDWLFYLAPAHRNADRKVQKATCSKRFMVLLKSDYLRLSRPTLASAYERTVAICAKEGKATLTTRTARRRLNDEVPRVTQVFAREGALGLAKCFPPQIRDRSSQTAMEGVNADCHKLDVFVIWPGDKKPSRAQLVAFQDLYSRKILSWRVDTSPNKVAVMAAFGDMIEQWGIPQRCVFDNGTEFANKWLTGGAPARFRFKINPDDPLGVLTQLGIRTIFATPGHGQAKPIERAFRDMADHIAKDPRFEGAYTGHKPDAKPENYGDRAIPIDEFIKVVAEGIERHNARLGRRTDTAMGGSFNEAFAKSYEANPVRKATAEQRRLWLMGAETRQLHKNDGGITFHKNRYWSGWMNQFAGQKMTLRFDPEDLHAGLYVYGLDGAFMGMAECLEKVGFFDLAGAKDHARKTAEYRRAEKRLLKAHRELTPHQLGKALDAVPPAMPVMPEAKIVQLVHGADRPTEARVTHQGRKVTQSAEEKATVLAFRAKHLEQQAAKAATKKETPREMYLRALDYERRSDAGERIGKAEIRWLNGFQTSPEYRAERDMDQSFGSAKRPK